MPDVWNEKYEQYLGIRPYNDAVGVLQDVHWSGGSFGYFPSYALGYMYAAQFKQALEKELDMAALLEEGNIAPIREWLTERIHRFGKTKKPLNLVRDATGEPLNAEHLIRYLEEKYKAIYCL